MELTDVRIRAAKSLSWVRRVVVVSAVAVSLPMSNSFGSETRHSRIGNEALVLVSQDLTGDARAGRETTSPVASGGTLPQVTVEARRKAMEHHVYDFVRKLTQNPRFRDESLPRWNAPLCFAVAGLPTDQGLFALGRLREIARTTGVRVMDAGCRYNFFVVFTGEPNKLLKKAIHQHPEAFTESGGAHEIQEFVTPSRPQAVRAWHNVETFTRGGIPVNREAACVTTLVGATYFTAMQAPISCAYSASRIERNDVPAFTSALVVVDTTYPKQAKLGQLVDYAAMVGLADISPSADIADAPSVLHLFDEASDAVPPEGLTNWDRAFLRGLYDTDQASRTQRFQIVDTMLDDVVDEQLH